jgi:hypothetical protein
MLPQAHEIGAFRAGAGTRRRLRVIDGVQFTRRDYTAAVTRLNAAPAGPPFLFVRNIIFDPRTGDSLPVNEIGPQSLSNSSPRTVYLLRTIILLGLGGFYECRLLSSVCFEAGSQLRRTESYSFSCCPLRSFSIPDLVDFVCGTAFSGVSDCSIVSASPHYVFRPDVLLDSDARHLVRYFGQQRFLVVPCNVALRSPYCLSVWLQLCSIRRLRKSFGVAAG